MPRHSRPARRRTTKQRDDRRGIALIASALLVLGTGAWLLSQSGDVERDARTGCPKGQNSAPPAHTLILLDQTDSLPEDEIAYARHLIWNEYQWLPQNGVMTVKSISTVGPATEVKVCRMPLARETNVALNNPRAIEREFKRSAGQRIELLLERLSRAPEQEQSPIIEAVMSVFRRLDYGSDVEARRLIILSDMLQNSSLLSHYQRSVDPSPVVARIRDSGIDMSNVSIRIHYVRREPASRQTPAHRAFWQRLLEESGSSDVAIGHSLDLGEDGGREIWYEEGPPEKG